MSPQRIQRRRTKGWKMPENTVYVGRGSRWGNPYRVVPAGSCNVSPRLNSQWRNADHWHVHWPDSDTWCYETRAEANERAVDLFELMIHPASTQKDYPLSDAISEALAGKNLACWCPESLPCHADVLLEIANRGTMSPENIKLQPDYDHDGSGVIPYPLFINPVTGAVERAHPAIYKGITRLLGFASQADPYDVAVTFPEYAADPASATGLHPIFEEKGGIATHAWTARDPEQDKA